MYSYWKGHNFDMDLPVPGNNIFPDSLLYFLAKQEIFSTYAEGRRVLCGGGIKIDGETVKQNVYLESGQEIRIGKHKKITYLVDDSDCRH